MGGPSIPTGGRLLQRLRNWSIAFEGVTDGNESVVNRIRVNGLTGLELRTILRDLADARIPMQGGATGGGDGAPTPTGSVPSAPATGGNGSTVGSTPPPPNEQ